MVHLSFGTKDRFNRSDPFNWSLGWIDPVSFEIWVEVK